MLASTDLRCVRHARLSGVTLVVLNWIGLLCCTAVGICVGILLRRHLQRHELPEDSTESASGFLTDAQAYLSLDL